MLTRFAGFLLLITLLVLRLEGSDIPPDAIATRAAAIEATTGGRLGVAVIEPDSQPWTGLHANERFPMCSTFKVLAAAAVLARVDAGKEDLSRRIVFQKSDLLAYSPVTQEHTGGKGMTLADLCEAAITHSDNTAANLLIARVGGPAEVTAYVRTLGDKVTRLDRIEPHLNEAKPGDPRDTTTPAAMAKTLQALVLGKALSKSSRDRLIAWLNANTTGDARLRAGVPKDWVVGDKTGTGARGTTNDIAVFWRPGQGPLVVAVYLTDTTATEAQRNAAVASVGKAIAEVMKLEETP